MFRVKCLVYEAVGLKLYRGMQGRCTIVRIHAGFKGLGLSGF